MEKQDKLPLELFPLLKPAPRVAFSYQYIRTPGEETRVEPTGTAAAAPALTGPVVWSNTQLVRDVRELLSLTWTRLSATTEPLR